MIGLTDADNFMRDEKKIHLNNFERARAHKSFTASCFHTVCIRYFIAHSAVCDWFMQWNFNVQPVIFITVAVVAAAFFSFHFFRSFKVLTLFELKAHSTKIDAITRLSRVCVCVSVYDSLLLILLFLFRRRLL